MSEPSLLSWANLTHQLREHVDSLRSAGVEWIPNAPAPAGLAMSEGVSAGATESIASAEAMVLTGSLFESAAQPVASPEQRRQELTVLAAQVSKCTRCSEL